MSCAICGDEMPLHVVEDLLCLGGHPAGSQSILVIWCDDNITDYEDPVQLAAAIAAREADLFEMIRFGSTPGSPVTGNKYIPCGTPAVIYTTQNMTWSDYNYDADNFELYTLATGGRQAQAVLAWDSTKAGYSDTSRLYLATNGKIQFSGGLNSPDDCDEESRFELAAEFRGSVSLIPTPAGIFS